MTKIGRYLMGIFGLFLFIVTFILTGCAPLLIAGGAAGGYAVAKHHDEERVDKGKPI